MVVMLLLYGGDEETKRTKVLVATTSEIDNDYKNLTRETNIGIKIIQQQHEKL